MGMPVAKKCELCGLPTQNYFETIIAYDNHIKTVHQASYPQESIGDGWKCYTCNTYFNSCNALTTHKNQTGHL